MRESPLRPQRSWFHSWWAFGATPFDTRVTFPVVEQGSVVLVRTEGIGTWLCLFDTDSKAANRAARALAALGVNTLDVVVIAGSPADLPDQLDTLFGLLAPNHVYLPSLYVRTPIPGLDARFQSTIVPLDTGEMVVVETAVRPSGQERPVSLAPRWRS